MKSSKFISLLAMTALMAACSQEDFVSVDNDTKAVDLSARPVLGNVELGIADPSTRMAITDNSAINAKFEAGDQIGAAIIDKLADNVETTAKTGYKKVSGAWKSDTWTYTQYINGVVGANTKALYTQTKASSADNAANNSAQDWYETVEYISTNYPYTMGEGGAFTTDASLVEGNYFFYMPYDAAYQYRARLNAVLPQIQDCSETVMKETTWMGTEKVNTSSTAIEQLYKGTTEGFEKAMAVVGYEFLAAKADGSKIKPNVTLSTLYAYPLITIKNNFNGLVYNNDLGKALATARATKTITIDSIQIYHDVATDNKLFYTAPINSENVVDILGDNSGEWDKARLGAGAPTADILDGTVVANYPKHADVETANPVATITNFTYQPNHVTCKIGKELKSGESYSFHAVLPAANYGHDLKARIFAQMDGKRVVIMDATNAPTKDAKGSITKYGATVSAVDYAFEDEVNGGKDCELVRGQQFPKVEIRENGEAIKAFAGTMMTIDLNSTINNTSTVTGATAFILKEKGVDPTDQGIKTNDELIAYIQNYLQRGVALYEVAAMRYTDKKSWKTYTGTGATTGNKAGQIAFAANNSIVIDAQLVKDLYNQTVEDASQGIMMLTLTSSNFPIAGDVTMTATAGGYKFTTFDGVSFEIDYTSDVTFGTNVAQLVPGINKIAATGAAELKPKSGTTNAVVMLESSASVSYTTNSTGISAIYVPSGTTLAVNAACDALVIAEGNITMGTSGSLTNGRNVYTGATINNTNKRQIAGGLKSNTTISATFTVWPTEALAATTRINSLTINPASAGTVLAIDQTQVDMLGNLSGVAVSLSANVASITSTADVSIDKNKVKSIAAATASINWNTTAAGTVTISAKGVTVTNITAGTNVTIATN